MGGEKIYPEMCTKFDKTCNWYVHKPESEQKYETHKIFWNLEIEIDPLFSARRTARGPHLEIINHK